MFTGLIEEIGIIKNIASSGGGKKIQIQCKKILSDSKIDDSIAVNGVCQTVTGITGDMFEFVSVEETLKKTTIKHWQVNKKVNLERALKLSDRLGGHLLLGHIDTFSQVMNKTELHTSTIFEIKIPPEFSKYVIPKGSIAVDGISLTIAELKEHSFIVSVIPHTIDNTILRSINMGDEVNLEFDLIGKYIERLIAGKKEENGLTFEKLKELGY
jgi:riboflavin synthase